MPRVAANDDVPVVIEIVGEFTTLAEALLLFVMLLASDEDCVTDAEAVCGQYSMGNKPNVMSAANTLKRSRLRTASPL